MFTIVIPLYNKVEYVVKAINSVLLQTFRDFELIIVDDGSTDKSVEIAEGVYDARIRIVKQNNSGVSTARNNGVALAKYDYVAFLDADDWWHQDFLLEMSSLIDKYKDAAIYASHYFIVKNGTQRQVNIGVDSEFSDGYINYCKVYANTYAMPITSSSVVIKRAAFLAQNGFNTHLKFGEDFDLWLRLALTNKIAFTSKCLAYYNQDVPVQNRALGNKLWKLEEHYIFNLGYIKPEEAVNVDLKRLLDGLRVRALVRYKRAGVFPKEVKSIIREVDFNQQPFLYTVIYKYPKVATEIYLLVKEKGSIVKQFLVKSFKK
jgi:glycosyltransferase involved in cell wall biosynthesis